MVGLPFQYCHEHKLKLPQLSLRAVMNVETACIEYRFRGISVRTFLQNIDLKPHITHFAFGFLTNDGRHILTLKNKSTSVEWEWLSGVSSVSQVSSAKLHHVFTSQQLPMVSASIVVFVLSGREMTIFTSRCCW